MLACAALVVEGDDILRGARHVNHDEADARVEFARTPFDLCDDQPYSEVAKRLKKPSSKAETSAVP
jgi:hypothetical protein